MHRSDPTIPIIPWDEIEVGDRVGSGVSGIVMRGIWHVTAGTASKTTDIKASSASSSDISELMQLPLRPKPGTSKQVALKHLVYGVGDMNDSLLNEFMVEIKLMRCVMARRRSSRVLKVYLVHCARSMLWSS